MAKADIKPRIRIPKSVKAGEVFEVKTLVSHEMETGLRVNKETGAKIPRDIINEMKVNYDGKEVLRAVWQPSVSANPYTSFFVMATKSGPMEFIWSDDSGTSYNKTVEVNVS
ncbi:MAG: thiosulfate oxidation carrier complex protein SoxZ [Rhodospirillaceae bacterium]|nr:thiosulfate oxidation carrier complex protein SoxZ [Rhodospirillaceae bacterium]